MRNKFTFHKNTINNHLRQTNTSIKIYIRYIYKNKHYHNSTVNKTLNKYHTANQKHNSAAIFDYTDAQTLAMNEEQVKQHMLVQIFAIM